MALRIHGDARYQAATAHRDDKCPHLRERIQDLHGNGALRRYHAGWSYSSTSPYPWRAASSSASCFRANELSAAKTTSAPAVWVARIFLGGHSAT